MKKTFFVIFISTLFVCFTCQFNQAYAKNPGSPEQQLHYRLIWQESNDDSVKADSAYEKGDYNAAEEWALKSLKAAPLTLDGSRQDTNWLAFDVLAKSYLKQGKNAKVVKLYDEADLINRRGYVQREDLIILGLANVRLGNYNTALKYYNDKQLASISFKDYAADFPGIDTPKRLEASLLLTFTQLRSGWKIDRQDALEQAHELLPSNPLIAFWYGRHLYVIRNAPHKTTNLVIAESLRQLNLAANNGHGAVKKEAKEELEKIKQDNPALFKDKESTTRIVK
jgi:hypothetical protein